jgi:outer membrane protein OmpA-like peptidoglycan-associated protein/tetratricopeptide (TPR) repeat protein
MRIRSILSFVLVLMVSVSFAQTAKLKRAKQLMKDLAYKPAIVLLNQMLEKDDNADAKIAVAECYRKINDWENAEYWYSQVVRSPQVEPIHKLYYGEALQRNGKCDLARDWYAQFTQAAPEDVRGQFLNKACDFENELLTKNASLYEIKHMDFNSNLDDFSPSIFNDKVIFASDRDKGSAVKRDHTWTGNPFNELFTVTAKKDTKGGAADEYKFTYNKATKFSNTLNSKYHDAAVSFAKDGKTIYYTKNNRSGNDDEGTKKLKIYVADGNGTGSGWGDIKELPFNSDEYNTAHPSLTPDGKKLYFASDMPGGFGGMDIYVSEKEGEKWGPPMNLGPKINTEGHEIFPYMSDQGRFYFSSDSHVGLGGLDLYFIEQSEDNEWTAPTNLGYPINSKYDDFGLAIKEDGKFGYFTSDRPGGSGRDDIYSFRKLAIPAQIYVFDKSTKLPIENAVVVDSCSGAKYKTGKDGYARLDMRMETDCIFSASKETYLSNSVEGSSKGVDKVLVEIPLSKEYKATMEGVVFNSSTSLPLEGAKVILTNDCEKTAPDTLTTDQTGYIKFPIDLDCCYTVTAMKKDFFTNKSETFCTKNLTKDSLFKVTINLSPAVQQPPSIVNNPGTTTTTNQPGTPAVVYTPYSKNIGPAKYNDKTGLYETKGGKPANVKTKDGYVIENGNIVKTPKDVFPTSPTNILEPAPGTSNAIAYLLHIYYDFDQSYLRDEANPELDKLLNLMNTNPTYIIEIGSHTDSRGSNAYNNRLSQRRAESVVRWLVKKGVDKERLVGVGYGETMNVNSCKNDVPCSEDEHQMNRRTEFKVLGCKGCLDNPILSTPNTGAKIDKCVGCPF